MERTAYIALVTREANLLVREHEDLVRAHGTDTGDSSDLDGLIDSQIAEILSEIDHLEDVIKWSELREPACSLWRNADNWQGVLIGAAMAALAHDVRVYAQRIIKGELPRLKNVQVN